MLHSSCEESCNHHHLPPQYPFSGNYPGTDAITNPVNALRYPANAGQLSRATFSGARTIMVFSGSGFYATLPIASSVSAVASLPIFLINHFTNSVINYTEQQGVFTKLCRCCQNTTTTKRKSSSPSPSFAQTNSGTVSFAR